MNLQRDFYCKWLSVVVLHLLFAACVACAQVNRPAAPSPSTYQAISPNQSIARTAVVGQQPSVPQTTTRGDSRQQVQDVLNEPDTRQRPNVQYELPSHQAIRGASFFRSAFARLSSEKDDDFKLTDAVLSIESAFYDNQLDLAELNLVLNEIGMFVKTVMQEQGYDTTSNLAKNLMLFRLFSDTLRSESLDLEHLPFKYDFTDYMGYEDWRSMFVEKLLRTNTGQCHSLPMLYLMLAEEIGAKAHLALSPNHSYIKFQDDRGTWHNLELTNGMLTTDAFVMQSGYIKTEALQSGIYMQPLDVRQLRAQMLVDLAQGYIAKFGYDRFVEEVAREALKLDPNNINANQVLSDYLTVSFLSVARQLGIRQENFADLQRYPKAMEMYGQMHAQYKKVDALGFEPMPLEDYEKWLNSLEEIKMKQESESIELKLNLGIPKQ